MTLDSCCSLYTLLLARLKVSITLTSAKDVTSEILVSIYRAITKDENPSVIGDPRESLDYILKSLSELVGIELNHISVDEILDANDSHLYDLAEIFLGLLDVIEEDHSITDDTDSLCRIESDPESDFILEPPQCPFSPIFDSSVEGTKKFPEIVNSSFSGSEVVSADEELQSENKNSSRSHKTDSSAKTSAKSLMNEIQNRIKNSELEPVAMVEPVKVSKVPEPSDITWTETAATSSNTNNSSNCKTPSHMQTDQTAEIKSDRSNHSADNSDDTEISEKIENLKISQNNDSDSMRLLLESLQKTVDKSKKAREEYKKQKAAYDKSRTDESGDTAALCLSSEREILFKDRKLRKSRRKSKKSQKPSPEEEFRKLLEREKELEQAKQELIVNEYRNQLDEIKMKAEKDQRDLAKEVSCQTSPDKPVIPVLIPAPSGRSKEPSKPEISEKPAGKMTQPRLEIGEGDMLKTILDEIPGLDYDQKTLKQLLDKQDKHTLLLTKEQQRYQQRLQNKDNQIEEVRKRQILMSKIAEKEDAAENRIKKLKEAKENENRLSKEVKQKRHKNAKIKKYFEDYQTGLRRSLTAKKTQEEQMLRRVFEDGLKIQKNRLRELRKYAKEMRAEEEKVRQKELEAIEKFYQDKFELLAEDMERQKKKISENQKESKKRLRSVKSELNKRLENEIKDMQDAIVKENESMFFRDLEQERLMNQIQVAKFTQKMNRASKI